MNQITKELDDLFNLFIHIYEEYMVITKTESDVII